MSSIKAKARKAGMLYLLLAIVAPFHQLYLPSAFYVAGVATSTAANIVARGQRTDSAFSPGSRPTSFFSP